ncbi:S8 family serine peptidase (plasmid) [Rhizobium leguminosarum]|uniref:S8 family serine peptidase n=1 Tax=Rhizobium leguminosarum TaxID=384 RepID=UPI001A938D9B|nr:S8 family serine peptidase [Rhizobium leguminosarum]MBY5558807.1 S8 family serine peptidase [Rhizobium leguminosarum]QSW27741.1 S8 family serine peptidase [Rhizobium leguminosarum]
MNDERTTGNRQSRSNHAVFRLTAEVIISPPERSLLATGDVRELWEFPKPAAAERIGRVSGLLETNGFNIHHAGPFSITIEGTSQQFIQAFGCRFADGPHSRARSAFSNADPSLHVPIDKRWQEIEGVVLIPIESYSASSDSGPSDSDENHTHHLPKPQVDYYHLNAPRDLVTNLCANEAHAKNICGQDIDVVVVDSGWWNHPWFQDRGLHVDVVLAPGASAPELDEVGHGTMVCASLMSLAPNAKVTMIKQSGEDAFTAFKMAIDRAPAIIQNTWGMPASHGPLDAAQKLVALTVLYAINNGIIVVFAGGNEKKLFPQQMHETIAVGGSFVHRDGSLEAASYASGYESRLFPGRIVPDFCGLVGMKPEGVYLMMPTMPGSEIDVAFAEKPYAYGDGTDRPDDGWVVISGTSSGSAQVSGVISMLKQVQPSLDQKAAKELIARCTRPVLYGVSAEGNPAGLPLPNLATGYGLVDAEKALRELDAAL